MADGMEVYSPACGCSKALGFPGPLATWDCPMRYYSQRGACPGFLPDGHRDPAAWDGDEINEETRRQWKHFVAAHDGFPALRLAQSALNGPPSFD